MVGLVIHYRGRSNNFPELNGGKEFFARYDRRHDISDGIGLYEIKENITLSGTWVYGTGNAITLAHK